MLFSGTRADKKTPAATVICSWVIRADSAIQQEAIILLSDIKRAMLIQQEHLILSSAVTAVLITAPGTIIPLSDFIPVI